MLAFEQEYASLRLDRLERADMTVRATLPTVLERLVYVIYVLDGLSMTIWYSLLERMCRNVSIQSRRKQMKKKNLRGL